MNLKRYKFALFSTGLVLLISFAVANTLSSNIATNTASIDIFHLLGFYTSIALIYFISIILWRNFSNCTQQHRSVTEAILDTGLIAIGKYIPGKIWGILARGGVKDGRIVASRSSVSVSALEQIFVLLLGMLLTILLILFQSSATMAAWIILSVITAIALAIPIIRWATRKLSISADIPPISIQKGIAMSTGYLFLWALTSAPIMILISSELALDLEQVISIISAFTGAMLAGWIAVFSPGGVGIREAVFAAVAPTGLNWQQALYWISLHRALYTLFDLFFGGSCLLILARGIRGARTDA